MVDEDTRQWRMRARMRFPVADQAWFLREGFAADIAHVRPDAGVNQQMLFECGPASERLAADGAAVRFVPGVDPHVHLQSTVPREGFAALLAHHVLPALVLPEHVLVEVFLADHSPLAYLTLVLGLVVRELLMHVQGVAVETGLAANVADHRLLPVAEAYVVRQVALDLELLAAGLAGEFEVVRVLARDVYLQLVFVLVLIVALVAVEELRLRVAGAPRLLVLPLYVRVQRRLLAGLEAAFVARVHLADVLQLPVPTFMRVQSALLRAREIAEIAALTDILLAGFLRDVIAGDSLVVAIFDANFLLNRQTGVFVWD